MIKINGQLAIRTINGRNGAFNVGRLCTSIGEFVVKDSLLDQYDEGKYIGEFVITQISPSSYSHSGRTVIEVRARLDSMLLDDMDTLSQADTERLDPKEIDPLDEETATAPTPAASCAPSSTTGTADTDEVPFGMPAKPSTPATVHDDDERLFGTLWPLNECVKLDSTVDRQRLRMQCARLDQLGYRLDFKQQAWLLATG
ncbi:hypothetical protein C5U62_32785 [Pseudomonas protegens]|uniref:DUF3275 family protein n=1 Tax=Pseudomonas protegens TaxID=380021 RepID=A0A2T6GAV4_9PSED|nr:DUF3275 family protein [Pseudomonas protegens]PUA41279.1 hypothetical protein C5U62_32785 [Pseudomonas protegens]